MTAPSLIPRLTDIIEAIEHVYEALGNITLDVLETDWQRQWLVQRGIEIISEASRHLTGDMKDRHPAIPWRKVAGIGNILRHNYENISSPLMWKLVQEDLPALEKACREELVSCYSNGFTMRNFF